MRSAIQWLGFGALFLAVGALAYYTSGAADPLPGEVPPEDPRHPRQHYISRWSEDFAAAQKSAAGQQRLILARFTGSDWCIYCKEFHAEIEDTPEFQQWAADNVVLFDADFPHTLPQSVSVKEQNAALAKKYDVDGFPTLLLLKPDGTEVARLGYVPGGPKAWLPDAKPYIEAWSGKLARPPAQPAPAPVTPPAPVQP